MVAVKYLVSYAFDNGSGLQIRDATITQACPFLDEKAIETIRAHLVGKHHTPVSIIAITKLES